MFVEYVEYFTLSRYGYGWEVLDHLGRGYNFPTEDEARAWISTELA